MVGKETELWDDSALIKAFDNAITKYKKMHGGNPSTVEEEQEKVVLYSNEENEESPSERGSEACLFSDNTVGASELPPIQNKHLGAESSATEPKKHSSTGPVAQETFEGYSQYADYNQKLSQYYELEEQRQKLLQELSHAGYRNYQDYTEGSDACLPWNECCAASQSQLPTYHGSYSYCPACCCHCLASSCASIPTCAMGDKCLSGSGAHAISTSCKADPVTTCHCSNDNIIKAAKEAAERAISSMKLNKSVTPGVCEENKTEGKQISDTSNVSVPQNEDTATDLTVVLNAWFSAGFYTGKYISEQSRSNSQP